MIIYSYISREASRLPILQNGILCWMEIRPEKLSWRFKFGAILLVSLALYSGWQSIRYYDIGIFTHRYEKYGTLASDSISRLENRLACLQAELAPGERVGFVSPLKGDDWGEVYRWTQYALAPAIVNSAETQGKMIAVYPGEKNLKQAKAEGYSILVDCHNGVGLLTLAETP